MRQTPWMLSESRRRCTLRRNSKLSYAALQQISVFFFFDPISHDLNSSRSADWVLDCTPITHRLNFFVSLCHSP